MKFETKSDEFDVEFMKEYGYVRKKCIKCGTYFWTPNPEQEACGESPCVNYGFLRDPPTRRRYDVHDMRDTFLKFFERNGHEILDPYPVVARWRDDLLVTIASIADFQPFITSGMADPPANPLVVSQPCLRFEDIMNVGLTAGRHLTIFEMGGAHAFNRREGGDFLYWKNGTIRFHHEFAASELGIPGDLITYKEHFWVGGGNAGPDVEGIIKGLEVSTLVFMMYQIMDDSLVLTPILTVDTGYGIERWAWLSQGVPTAFHTIYGPVLEWLLKNLDLVIEEEVLYENTVYSPHYSASNSEEVKKFRASIARKYGYDSSTIINKLSFFDDISVLLDHSKAIIFLVKDGAIPSNVKEGYLTRMLFRKIFRIAALRGIEDILPGLFREQIKYWGYAFKDISYAEDVIFEILDLELNKYKSILSRLPNIIRKYRKKEKALTLDNLIEIYDSHGISPELVSEYLFKKEGIELEVPSDFYSKVSEKHTKSTVQREVKGVKFPEFETERLFYINPYWSAMNAKVLYSKENYLVLNKTVFYGEGGGQVGDTGEIKVGDLEFRVINTFVANNTIVHVLDKKPKENLNGLMVTGYIDWDRRYALMRHHTATHILLGSIRRVLGNHVWQAGVEKRPDTAHLDITHYKLPTLEEIHLIEKLANEVVSKGIDVESIWMDRGLAEKLYGVRIYQGGMVPGKKLRLIKVGDWDIEACGGTHVSNTRELMYIKILSVDKIHDGIIRFNYVAGDVAIELSRKDQDTLDQLVKLLGVSRDEVFKAVSSLFDEIDVLRDSLERLEDEYVNLYIEKLYDEAEAIGRTKYIKVYRDDVNKLIKIGEKMEKEFNDVVFVGGSKTGRGINVLIFVGKALRDKGVSAYELGLNTVGKLLVGGGRGDERYARFGGRFEGELDIIFDVIKKGVRNVEF